MRYFVEIGSRMVEVELGPHGVRLDGEETVADLAEVDGTEVRTLLLDGRSHWILASRNEGGLWNLHLPGRRVQARVMDERTRAIREMTGGKAAAQGPAALKAPMPGLVVKVEVEEGDEIFPGQGLVIVEAMKMENELKAETHARVKAVKARPGEAVEKDQVLLELEAVPGSEEEGADA